MRLQESMLLVPMATRANFWAMKFISFVDLEQLKTPIEFGPAVPRACANPAGLEACRHGRSVRHDSDPVRAITGQDRNHVPPGLGRTFSP